MKSKTYKLGFFIIPTVLIIMSVVLYANIIGCGIGGSGLSCRFMERVFVPYVSGSILLLLIFIILSKALKYRESIKIPKAIIIFYVLISILVSVIILDLSNRGIISNLIEDSEIVCLIYGSKNGEPTNGSCYKELAIYKNDINYCEKIKPDGLYYNSCKTHFAVKENNHNICPQGDTSCLFKVALSKQDSELCLMIDDEYKQRNCLNELALTFTDISLAKQACDLSGNNSNFCMQHFILRKIKYTEDIKHCEYWSNHPGYKIECIEALAIQKSQPELCNLIVDLNTVDDEKLRAGCFFAVANETKNTDFCKYIPEKYPEMIDNCKNIQ